MGVDEGHAAPGGNELHLVQPEPGCFLAEHDQERVILGQGVGKLDETTTKEGPDRHRATRHRLEGVGVEK